MPERTSCADSVRLFILHLQIYERRRDAGIFGFYDWVYGKNWNGISLLLSANKETGVPFFTTVFRVACLSSDQQVKVKKHGESAALLTLPWRRRAQRCIVLVCFRVPFLSPGSGAFVDRGSSSPLEFLTGSEPESVELVNKAVNGIEIPSFFSTFPAVLLPYPTSTLFLVQVNSPCHTFLPSEGLSLLQRWWPALLIEYKLKFIVAPRKGRLTSTSRQSMLCFFFSFSQKVLADVATGHRWGLHLHSVMLQICSSGNVHGFANVPSWINKVKSNCLRSSITWKKSVFSFLQSTKTT